MAIEDEPELCKCGHRKTLHMTSGGSCFGISMTERDIDGFPSYCECDKFKATRRTTGGSNELTTIITRGALVHWGRKVPDNLASVVDGRIVTWDEVMEHRRKRQEERLRVLRQTQEWRAARIYVAYFGQWLMGGWQAFIDGIDGYHGRNHQWIDRDWHSAKRPLMNLFPLVFGFDEHASWQQWKVEFAKQYQRRQQDGQPVGVAYIWRRGYELRTTGGSNDGEQDLAG